MAKSRINKFNWKLSFSAPRLIANSSLLGKELESAGVPAERISVIPNIFEPDPEFADRQKLLEAGRSVRRSFNIPEDATVVSVIGRDAEEKDIPFFVESFAKAAAANPKLAAFMIGSGGLAQKARIRELGLEGRIILSNEAGSARKLLPAADIYFLSSSSEGMPNVLLEAADAGCAVISRDIGGVKDILGGLEKSDLDEILISGRNADEAAAKILRLAESAQRRAELSEKMRRLLKNFSPDIIMPEFYKIIESVKR